MDADTDWTVDTVTKATNSTPPSTRHLPQDTTKPSSTFHTPFSLYCGLNLDTQRLQAFCVEASTMAQFSSTVTYKFSAADNISL